MKIIVLMLTILLLGACSKSPDSRLYLLQPVNTGGGERNNNLTVEIGEISIPDHLSGDKIVTYVEGNQIVAAEFDRWAEPLDRNISAVLVQNLASALRTDRVLDDRSGLLENPDFLVEISVIRFSLEPGNKVSLEALWSLTNSKGETTNLQTFRAVRVSSNGTYGASIADMSVVLGDLAEEIARAILGVS